MTREPYFDFESRTHYVSDAVALTTLREGGEVHLGLDRFADAVSGDEWVWLEADGDGEVLGQVVGLAVVVAPRPEAEREADVEASRTGGSDG